VAGLLAMAALATAALAEDWHTFAPDGMGFSVEMPAVPQHRDNLQDPELFAAVDDYGADLDVGFAMVSVFTFHPEKRDLIGEADIFDLGEAMVQSGCQVLRSRPLPGGPGAARQTDFACADGVTISYRLHLYGDRLYRLAAGGPEGVAEGAGADRFFQSLDLE